MSERHIGWPKKLVLSAVAVFLMLLLFEGAASTITVAYRFFRSGDPPQLAESSHTRYDQTLGWRNEPRYADPDHYGPGRGLTVDGEGFRTHLKGRQASKSVRVLCSGDSFTLGFGVDDLESWPAVLSKLEPRFETVNLGQGGYGVGQAYLWAIEELEGVDPLLHLFAFIGYDFERMRDDRFLGHGKPLLRVIENGLQVTNVPVPQEVISTGSRWGNSLGELRLVRALRWLLPGDPSSSGHRLSLPEAERVARAILEDLRDRHLARGSVFVLIWLPLESELGTTDPPWHGFVRRTAMSLGIPLIDVKPHFESIPSERWSEFFSDSDQHYSASGYRLAAEAILAALRSLPDVHRILDER